MKVSIDFGRWTTTKAALAVSGALAIGGAVGSAVAISPTIAPPITWQGGVNIVQSSVPPVSNRLAYTVPAGTNFMLSDIIISNDSGTQASLQRIFTGAGGGCGSTSYRTSYLSVPAGETLHLALVTGIGFSAGQTVCISNADTGAETSWTMRGFLFTPS